MGIEVFKVEGEAMPSEPELGDKVHEDARSMLLI